MLPVGTSTPTPAVPETVKPNVVAFFRAPAVGAAFGVVAPAIGARAGTIRPPVNIAAVTDATRAERRNATPTFVLDTGLAVAERGQH